MEMVLALAIGVLTGSGVWLLLRPRTFHVIMGLALLSYAVNLFIFSMGRLGLAIDKEPVLQPGLPQDLAHYADPDLPRNGVFIATTDGWFREARLCYSKAYQPMPCPRGLGAPDRERLKLAPTGVSGTPQTTR